MCCALSCLNLCDPMYHSPPGSSVHGILHTRLLEWVTISSSRGSFQPRVPTCVSCIACTAGRFFIAEPRSLSMSKWVSEWVKSLSRVRLFVTPRTVDYQASPSMGFSRQEHWSGLPFPSPGDLPNLGIEPRSPLLQAVALPSEPSGKPGP